MKKYLICLLAVGLFLVGCKKEQPQMSALNEGCDCAKEVSAEFTMEELATPIGWIYGEKRTNTDTVYSGRNVLFYALEGDADYTWYVGSEVIHDRKFYRYFGTELEGQNLPMTLVVNKRQMRFVYRMMMAMTLS